MTPLLTPSDHSSAGNRHFLLPQRKFDCLSMKVQLHGSNPGYLSGLSSHHALPQINLLLQSFETQVGPFSDHQVRRDMKNLRPEPLQSVWQMPSCWLTQYKLWQKRADSSFFNMPEMPVLLFVAVVGATVGGLLSRQRRGELKRLNEQLRQINAALRRQAKIESYAPVGSRIAETVVIVDPRKDELIRRLKSGKNFLRNQDPEKAFSEFQLALELARTPDDPIEEKKAARGPRSFSSEAGEVESTPASTIPWFFKSLSVKGRMREILKLTAPSSTVTPSSATSSEQSGFMTSI